MLYDANEISYQMADLHLEGNIIPHTWYKKICFSNGKPYLNACAVLAEIIYWYRPVVLKDERGNICVKKKYKADLLQKSYEEFENIFGLSKKQCRETLIRLEELKLLKRIFRNVMGSDGRMINDVMFIQVFPEKIKEITSLEVTPPFPESKGGITSMEGGGSVEVIPYTETTTKTTYKRKEREATSSPPPSPLPSQKGKKDKVEKKSYRENIYLTEEQYEKLLQQDGLQKLNWKLDYLDAKKAANGYVYKSDYHVLLPTNWVEKEWEKNSKQKTFSDKKNAFSSKEENASRNLNLCSKIEVILRKNSKFSQQKVFSCYGQKATLTDTLKDIQKEYIFTSYEPDELKKILLTDLENVFCGVTDLLIPNKTPQTQVNNLISKLKTQCRIETI